MPLNERGVGNIYRFPERCQKKTRQLNDIRRWAIPTATRDRSGDAFQSPNMMPPDPFPLRDSWWMLTPNHATALNAQLAAKFHVEHGFRIFLGTYAEAIAVGAKTVVASEVAVLAGAEGAAR
jgi:hypothetical protein